jgi:hypothetical protein
MDKNETEQQILAEINKSKSFFQQHKKICVTGLILIAFFVLALISYNLGQKSASESIPGVTTVCSGKQIDGSDVSTAYRAQGKNISTNDAKTMTKIIEKSIETKAPTYQYYTTTDSSADKMAQRYAVAGKADVVIKQQESQQVGSTTVYDNKYYAVTNAKKHSISVGPSIDVDEHKVDTAISYRNRDMTFTVATDGHSIDNVTVQYQVARW